jgi:hypothetical protein
MSAPGIELGRVACVCVCVAVCVCVCSGGGGGGGGGGASCNFQAHTPFPKTAHSTPASATRAGVGWWGMGMPCVPSHASRSPWAIPPRGLVATGRPSATPRKNTMPTPPSTHSAAAHALCVCARGSHKGQHLREN